MFKTLARRPRRGRRRDARDVRPPFRARAGRQRDRGRTQERRRADGSVRPAPFFRMLKTPSRPQAFALCAGTLHSIDQYLNIKLLNTKVVDAARHPQLVAVTSVLLPAPALLLSSPRSCSRPCLNRFAGTSSVRRSSSAVPSSDISRSPPRTSTPSSCASRRAPATRARARRLARSRRRQDACRKASAKA